MAIIRLTSIPFQLLNTDNPTDVRTNGFVRARHEERKNNEINKITQRNSKLVVETLSGVDHLGAEYDVFPSDNFVQ